MTDLQDRAARIFGLSDGYVRWPYGMTRNDIGSPRHTDPQEYQQRLQELTARQNLIVDWAERYGLKTSKTQCCPAWLMRNASRHCLSGVRPNRECGKDNNHWLDHPTFWLKDRRPAAITSAPYFPDEEDDQRVWSWVSQDDRLCYLKGPGWYSSSTTQYLVWRLDVLPGVLPCEGLPEWQRDKEQP